MKTRLLAACLLIGLALAHGFAYAGRNFTYVQSPAAALAVFPMGSTQSLSYTITNANTGANDTELINQVQFNISNGSLLANATAPAGWTRTAFSSTSVTFKANSVASAIATDGSATFNLVLGMLSTTADVTQTLTSIIASNITPAGKKAKGAAKVTANNPGSWTLKSLTITSFQITDLSGNPITAVAAGSSFNLVMTVQNNSTVTQSGITSNPNPPGQTRTGTTTPALTGTAGSPLSLTAGSSGTITLTYSTALTKYGTVYFTAKAQNGATVTSANAISPTLTVVNCVFSASIAASASCLYPGQNISLTMTLSNSCSGALTSVTPTLSTTGPATLVSGPTPASIGSIAASGGTASVAWVYQINSAAATNPFTFTGSATSASPALTTPTAASPSILRGQFDIALNPNLTNASSTNVELNWNVTNNGCAAANSVAVTLPAGWIWANDAYSLVNLNPSTAVETWVPSGANPVTFTAPDVASQLPLTYDGDFNLVIAATPANAGTSIFTVNVTDAAGAVVSVPVSVTVNPYADANGLNNVNNNSWREQYP